MSKLITTGLERHYWCLDCGAYIANAGVTAHAVANPTHQLQVVEDLTVADPPALPFGLAAVPGSNQQVLFNAAGAVGAASNLYWDESVDQLEINGNVKIPQTTALLGIVRMGASLYLHSYKNPARTGQNLFLGLSAGNLTLGATGANVYNGSGNVGMGDNALQSLTEGYYNCAYGLDSMKSATTPYGNCAYGYKSMELTTIGIDNCAFGLLSMAKNVDGGGNSAFGADSLGSNVSGTNNCAFGYTTLFYNTASFNSAFGTAALASNISGTNNCAFGQAALNKNLTNGNNAFGYQALMNCTTGTANCAFGTNALTTLDTGNFNVAMGESALYAFKGTGNVAIGSLSQRFATGVQNVSVGYNSLYTTSSGVGNTSLGTSAGYTNSTGSASVFLGYNAGYYETAGNKLFIDNTNRGSEAGGRLLAMLYGVFNTTALTQTLRINALLGIDAVPTEALSIGGDSVRKIWMVRHLTADTAGNNLTIQAGGCTAAATSKAGGSLFLAPGTPTGTAKSDLRIQRFTRGAAATTDNTLKDAIIVPSEFNLTDAAANSIFTVALPAGTSFCGHVIFGINVLDAAGELQAYQGTLEITAENKAGVYTSTIPEATSTVSCTGGSTLTTAWSVTNSGAGGTITIVLTPTSSLAPTSMKLSYTLFNNSNQAITQL